MLKRIFARNMEVLRVKEVDGGRCITRSLLSTTGY
jgi:hypothetical protein